MAKWGEGDPRWIVEERPDAINVNNWHWTEKNACGWSKAKFKELFEDFTFENNKLKCTLTNIEKCEGEAVANNRKGKLIFFYEWELTLTFKANLKDKKDYVTGKIVIPNLSEENEVHEVDVNISVNETTPEADVVNSEMRKFAVEKIREQLAKYIQGLKAEFSQGMILPKKDDNTKSKENINNLSSGFESKVQVNNMSSTVTSKTTSAQSTANVGVKFDTTTLNFNQKFQCTALELYNALTVTEMVIAFTHGPVTLDVRNGGKFELFGGNIFGEFVEIVPNSKIVQKWRYKQWPSGHFSIVTIDLQQKSDHTKLKLQQTGVPSGESEQTKMNWERYYWEPLKRTFGFGYFI